MKKMVIGQDKAIKLVFRDIISKLCGIKDPNRPIGSFIFLGPIIMTSNIGSQYILDNLPNKDALIAAEIRTYFKPEFLNRIDEIITFNSLSKDVTYSILEKSIKEIEDRLKEKQIKLDITKKAEDFIINESYDEKYGARVIKRFVVKNVETLIANLIINGEIKYGDNLIIDANSKGLNVNVKRS